MTDEDRQARLAKALRDNLRRRKAEPVTAMTQPSGQSAATAPMRREEPLRPKRGAFPREAAPQDETAQPPGASPGETTPSDAEPV